MIARASDGVCPGCESELDVHPLTTWNAREAQPWGCCHCCSRAWRVEMRGEEGPSLVATACLQHECWTCDHPLPGGTWTPSQHLAHLRTLKHFPPAEYPARRTKSSR